VTDLINFINETSTIVVKQVPLQSLDSSADLVASYIADTGGWLPDSPLRPTGEGKPANGLTPQENADLITTDAYNSVYNLNFQVNVTLNVQVAEKLTPGLDLPTAAFSMANLLTDFITDRINDSELPLRVDDVGIKAPISDRSCLGGYTTPEIRQTIADDLLNASTTKIVDFKASTLLYTKNNFGLDDTWNVVSVYTEASEPIAVEIQKYTTETYDTIDDTSNKIYMINISPDTYVAVAGVILTPRIPV